MNRCVVGGVIALLLGTGCKEKCEQWPEVQLEEIRICNDKSVEGTSKLAHEELLHSLEQRGWKQLFDPNEKVERLADNTTWESVGHGRVDITKANFGTVYLHDSLKTGELLSAQEVAPALKLTETTAERVKALRTALKSAEGKLLGAPARATDAALDALDPDKTSRARLVVIEAAALDAPTEGIHNTVLWFPQKTQPSFDTLRSRLPAAQAVELLSKSRLALVAFELTHTEQRTSASGIDNMEWIDKPHLVQAKLALVDLQTGDVLARTELVSKQARTGKSDDQTAFDRWRGGITADFQAAAQKMNGGLRVATK